MAFDFITEFKKLCVQLQKEDVAIYFEQAKKMNDMDQELQELIGKFNLAKFNMNIEMNKQEGRDEALIKKYEAEKEPDHGVRHCNRGISGDHFFLHFHYDAAAGTV